MKVINYRFPQKTNSIHRTAVALGFFDGMHVGHRELIALLVKRSHELGLIPCVMTFTQNLSESKKVQSLLYNTEDKLKIFESLGVEMVFLTDFDSISSLSASEFISEVLIDAFGAELALSGYNFRFGKGASANASDLVSLMRNSGKNAEVLEEQSMLGAPISATRIRGLMHNLCLDEANKLLGTPYFIRGVVERGLGLGKAYGFPTVNIPISDSSPLTVGVYRTAVRIGNKLYTGITNVGTCPTIEERAVHAETLIADFDKEIYGEEIYVYFLGYIRDERKFDTVEQLRDQIYKDKEIAIKENGDLSWLETGLSLQ